MHVLKNSELRKRQNSLHVIILKKLEKWYLGPFSYLSLKYEVINTFPEATVTVETKVTFLVLPRERLQDSIIIERGEKPSAIVAQKQTIKPRPNAGNFDLRTYVKNTELY